MNHFKFFKLPLDIQFKILEEYISDECKKSILIHIPQFNKLLKHSESWSKHKLSLPRYFQLIHLSKHGYFLDSETEKHLILIKFNVTIYSLDFEYYGWNSEHYQLFNKHYVFNHVNLMDISNALKKFYDTRTRIVNFEKKKDKIYVVPYKKLYL